MKKLTVALFQDHLRLWVRLDLLFDHNMTWGTDYLP